MLLLTRKHDQSIVIGDNAEVKIKVIGIQHGQVRLGIDAPKEIVVHREEVYEQIAADKKESQVASTVA